MSTCGLEVIVRNLYQQAKCSIRCWLSTLFKGRLIYYARRFWGLIDPPPSCTQYDMTSLLQHITYCARIWVHPLPPPKAACILNQWPLTLIRFGLLLDTLRVAPRTLPVSTRTATQNEIIWVTDLSKSTRVGVCRCDRSQGLAGDRVLPDGELEGVALEDGDVVVGVRHKHSDLARRQNVASSRYC